MGTVSSGDLVIVESSPLFEFVGEVVTQAYKYKSIQTCSCYFTLCIDCLHGLNYNGGKEQTGMFDWMLEWFRLGSSAEMLWQVGMLGQTQGLSLGEALRKNKKDHIS